VLTIVVGNKNYSSWSLRGWLMLRKTGQKFEEVVVPLDQPDTAASIKKYSPSGRVPVLLDGDVTVWDSLAIGEYLAEKHPAAKLWPQDRASRALARSISAEMHSGFVALRTHCPMKMRERIQQGTPPEALADAARVQDIWNSTLQKHGGPFLFGSFTIADAMFAPVVSRFRTYSLPLSGPAVAYAEAVWNDPDFQVWYEAARTETLRLPKYESAKSI
jgi:glutathione S-transferase